MTAASSTTAITPAPIPALAEVDSVEEGLPVLCGRLVLVEVVVKGDVSLGVGEVGSLHMLCCCLASQPRDGSKW
jgi:hypothetical protein